eukprot:756307-Hanusia_phi.AAC.5
MAKERLFLVIQADRARMKMTSSRPVPLAAIASRSLLRELVRTSYLSLAESAMVPKVECRRKRFWGNVVLRKVAAFCLLLMLGTYHLPFIL